MPCPFLGRASLAWFLVNPTLLPISEPTEATACTLSPPALCSLHRHPRHTPMCCHMAPLPKFSAGHTVPRAPLISLSLFSSAKTLLPKALHTRCPLLFQPFQSLGPADKEGCAQPPCYRLRPVTAVSAPGLAAAAMSLHVASDSLTPQLLFSPDAISSSEHKASPNLPRRAPVCMPAAAGAQLPERHTCHPPPTPVLYCGERTGQGHSRLFHLLLLPVPPGFSASIHGMSTHPAA